MPTPTLTLRLPPKVRSDLEKLAARERLTVTQYVRRVLWDHVEPREAEANRGEAGKSEPEASR